MLLFCTTTVIGWRTCSQCKMLGKISLHPKNKKVALSQRDALILREDASAWSAVWKIFFCVYYSRESKNTKRPRSLLCLLHIPADHLSVKNMASCPSRRPQHRALRQSCGSPHQAERCTGSSPAGFLDCPPFTSNRAINTKHNFILSLSSCSISL